MAAALKFLGGAALLVWSAALIRTDIRELRLPNVLTLPGALVIAAVAAASGRGVPAVLGGLCLAALYLLVHLVSPAAIGVGDAKLALATGALTGACGLPVWALAALAAPALTATVGVFAVARGQGHTVPHGPSMCVASLSMTALALL